MLKQWALPLIHNPIYSLNPDLPLSLGHVILFGRLRLGHGTTSRDWGFTLPSTSAESISLWYSQWSYSLIEIIIVSGYHIQEIGPWRWRLKTMYAPCCSRGADMVLLATGTGRIASCDVEVLSPSGLLERSEVLIFHASYLKRTQYPWPRSAPPNRRLPFIALERKRTGDTELEIQEEKWPTYWILW